MEKIKQLKITNDHYVTRNVVTECFAELNEYKHLGEKMV